MFDFMKNMSQLKGKMSEVQKQLDKYEVAASSGGGIVTATANGSGQLVKLEIKEDALDGDNEMLQDLILSAANEAISRAQEQAKKEIGKLTGGMNIPGLF
jgi:DNA-binding YbaB/EbfC family protein